MTPGPQAPNISKAMHTTTNTQELINNLLNERESEYLEFKTAKGGLPRNMVEGRPTLQSLMLI